MGWFKNQLWMIANILEVAGMNKLDRQIRGFKKLRIKKRDSP
jgi:hypothetical protein